MLDRVRVSAPCEADWGEMRGDERVRFCDRCGLNVYNISAMTRREAERLVMASEGRLCTRFYRRKDGTTLTRNCPVGLRALKRRASRLASAAAAAAISFFAGVGVAPTRTHTEPLASRNEPTLGGPVSAAAEEFEVSQGLTTSGDSPVAGPFVGGALLGSMIFMVGYPLLKIRQRREAKGREALRIWRQE